MSFEFADVNEFDQYARAHGDWFYDNSWQYHGKSFSCYGGHAYRDDKGELGELVLLSDCPAEGQGVVLEVRNGSQPEVWTGHIRTKTDIDALQSFVEAWDHSHQAMT